MTTAISSDVFSQELLALMTETFESVQGIYLDRGTSLFETLAEISAAEASIPVGGHCASIAAQTAHVQFYLEVLEQFMRGEHPSKVDWGHIWATVQAVTPEEWAASQASLRTTYQRVRAFVESYHDWNTENSIGGALSIVAHTAYHLGEIRQATCTVKQGR